MVFDSANLKRIDERIASPSQRAEMIWEALKQALPDATNWDVLCFCVEFQGMISQEYLWLEEAAKKAATLVYSAHYLYPEKVDASSGISPRDLHQWGLTRREPEGRSTRPDAPRGLLGRSNQDGPVRLYLPDAQNGSSRENQDEDSTREGIRGDSPNPNA